MQPLDRYLTLKEVEGITTFRKPTIYRLIKSGDFPCQIRISPNRVAWLASEVGQWLEARAAQRDAG